MFCSSLENATESKSQVLTVNSEEEQAFVADLLFKKRTDIVDDIWLGARFDEASKNFRWQGDFGSGLELSNKFDGKRANYANWQKGEKPQKNVNNSKNSCVEIISSDKTHRGKWKVTSCSKFNIAVCERPQIWSASRQQAEILKLSRLNSYLLKENDKLQKLQEKNKKLIIFQHKNMKLVQNLIPIGFLYVQLPYEAPPSKLWSFIGYNWTDVSKNYSGIFFRVAGGDAASFGKIQDQEFPQIKDIFSGFCYVDNWDDGCSRKGQYYKARYANASKKITLDYNGKDAWSRPIFSSHFNILGGKDTYNTVNYLYFKTTKGPVRPRNMAVKVWKRNG